MKKRARAIAIVKVIVILLLQVTNKTNSDKDPPTINRFIGGNKGKIFILVHSTGKTIWYVVAKNLHQLIMAKRLTYK